MNITKIAFRGDEYLIIGTVESGGPIATKDQFENCLQSFAYLKNGDVLRFGKKIGDINEITLLK